MGPSRAPTKSGGGWAGTPATRTHAGRIGATDSSRAAPDDSSPTATLGTPPTATEATQPSKYEEEPYPLGMRNRVDMLRIDAPPPHWA